MINILLDATKLFGIKLINTSDLIELIVRFIFNFGIILLIVRGIYYKKTKRSDFLFTFLMIGISIFLMCFLLESVKLELGFALGLFAVFGIIRYRTTTIQIKEMTYLFIVISLSVINALSNKKISYAELLLANAVVIGIVYFIERIKMLEPESFAIVMYEKIELVSPDKRSELIADLEQRMSIKISRIEITNIDYIRDSAKIKVFFLKSDQTWSNDKTIDYRQNIDE
jgi:hypothetical protein